MTLVALCTASGAPGATTMACLLGAVWPLARPVVVAECDPAGGALAARFGLVGNVGMTSFVLANRQDSGPSTGGGNWVGAAGVEPHLQRLPGGLEVLVGPPGPEAARIVDAEIGAMPSLLKLDRDLVVDCGRLVAGAPGQQAVLAVADAVVAVVSDDPADVAILAASGERLRDACGKGFSVAVVTGRRSTAEEIATMVGGKLAAVVPQDPGAAAVVRGCPGRARRLTRAPLVAAATRLQQRIVP